MDVNLFATLRELAGHRTVQFDMPDGSTVRELLDRVITEYPAMRDELFGEDGELFGHVHVFINGRDAPLLDRKLATVLEEADTVDVFPAVAGG